MFQTLVMVRVRASKFDPVVNGPFQMGWCCIDKNGPGARPKKMPLKKVII